MRFVVVYKPVNSFQLRVIDRLISFTMAKRQFVAVIIAAALSPLVHAVSSQAYSWKNVKIGGGGGFVPGIVFNPSQKVTN